MSILKATVLAAFVTSLSFHSAKAATQTQIMQNVNNRLEKLSQSFKDKGAIDTFESLNGHNDRKEGEFIKQRAFEAPSLEGGGAIICVRDGEIVGSEDPESLGKDVTKDFAIGEAIQDLKKSKDEKVMVQYTRKQTDNPDEVMTAIVWGRKALMGEKAATQEKSKFFCYITLPNIVTYTKKIDK